MLERLRQSLALRLALQYALVFAFFAAALGGACAAVLAVCAVFAVIVSWGVTVGALANSTMLGITVFWRLSVSDTVAGVVFSNALNLSMNCCSVHEPMPVLASGVMFAERTW